MSPVLHKGHWTRAASAQQRAALWENRNTAEMISSVQASESVAKSIQTPGVKGSLLLFAQAIRACYIIFEYRIYISRKAVDLFETSRKNKHGKMES